MVDYLHIKTTQLSCCQVCWFLQCDESGNHSKQYSLFKISTGDITVRQNSIVKEETEKCSLGLGSAASGWDIAVLCTAPITDSLSWQVINQKLQASSSNRTTSRMFQFMLPVGRPTWASKCIAMHYNQSLFCSRAKSSHFFFPAKLSHLCRQWVCKEKKCLYHHLPQLSWRTHFRDH